MEAPNDTKGASLKNEMIELEPDREVAREMDQVIQSITKCVDRGIDPESGKRGKCHVLLDFSNVCECKEVDLNKYKLR